MIEEVKKRTLSDEEKFVSTRQSVLKEDESEVETISNLDSIVEDEEELERIVSIVRNNPSERSNKRYRTIFNKLVERNSEEIVSLKKEVQKEKETIYKKLRSEKVYSASIKDSNSLKTNYIEVFGMKKDSISFEDYVALLELKKLLEIDEQIALSGVEKT
mgnify:CR=1 FL=1